MELQLGKAKRASAEACLRQLLLGTLLLRRVPDRSSQPVPPPTQLWHVVTQLRAEIRNLHQVVRKLAGLASARVPPTLGAELEQSAHNKTNNNNKNNNNENDHNKNIQESGLGSLDLDDDHPESSLSGSEPDLDESSLDSFDPTGQADSSFDNLANKQ